MLSSISRSANSSLTASLDCALCGHSLRNALMVDRFPSCSGESFVLSNPRLHDCPIVLASPAFCTLTGYSREEIVGRNCRFLQGEATAPEDVSAIRTAIAEHKREFRSPSALGTSLTAFVCSQPSHNSFSTTTRRATRSSTCCVSCLCSILLARLHTWSVRLTALLFPHARCRC